MGRCVYCSNTCVVAMHIMDNDKIADVRCHCLTEQHDFKYAHQWNYHSHSLIACLASPMPSASTYIVCMLNSSIPMHLRRNQIAFTYTFQDAFCTGLSLVRYPLNLISAYLPPSTQSEYVSMLIYWNRRLRSHSKLSAAIELLSVHVNDTSWYVESEWSHVST